VALSARQHRLHGRAAPRLAVNTTEAAIKAALADLGVIRVLSYQVADELRSGQLQMLLADLAPEPMPISLVYGAAELLPLKSEASWTGLCRAYGPVWPSWI
jgi:DNA-binding transcriptional LysR family regulator